MTTATPPDFENLEQLRQYLLGYAECRDWQQFHSPKNLVMALSVEASELLELFQWLTPEQSHKLPQNTRCAVQQEMADVFMYLVRLADVLEVDLLQACREKAALNETRYPADKVRGSAKKYTEYE
ncbi:NTP pyrophosphatase (non-canonical NTP hydrolase) [Alteromonadaceae bacterium 2753L.S.0a.02]|nr:NTP pyrophosphatase (non-canonical NTP hydrolase) [Alteromonadaceae bacterium 2753L.S.0a.02]